MDNNRLRSRIWLAIASAATLACAVYALAAPFYESH